MYNPGFYNGSNAQSPSMNNSEAGTSYLLVSTSKANSAININAYINGDKNNELQKKLELFGELHDLPKHLNLFNSLEEVQTYKDSLSPTGATEKTSAILCLNVSKEDAIEKIREGNLSSVINKEKTLDTFNANPFQKSTFGK